MGRKKRFEIVAVMTRSLKAYYHVLFLKRSKLIKQDFEALLIVLKRELNTVFRGDKTVVLVLRYIDTDINHTHTSNEQISTVISPARLYLIIM